MVEHLTAEHADDPRVEYEGYHIRADRPAAELRAEAADLTDWADMIDRGELR